MNNDYIDFGIVFRIDDLDSDGIFYIGETTSEINWSNGYLGTGSKKWNNYLKKYPPISKYPNHPNAHHYKRTILRNNFRTKEELYKAELEEILKYATWNQIKNKYEITDPKCKNVRCHKQGRKYLPNEIEDFICSECGGTKFSHKVTCSKSTKKPCEYCGSYTVHRKGCIKYKKNKPCNECGGLNHHKQSCSRYKYIEPKICIECGSKRRHKKNCSKYKMNKRCSECGNMTNHKKDCSKYKQKEPCPECGSVGPLHKNYCSQFKQYGSVCDECAGKGGTHKKTCSKYYKNRSDE